MSYKKTKLNISIEEKDVAKKYGARWDYENKYWYMPHYEDYLTVSNTQGSISQDSYESLQAINNIAKELGKSTLSIIPQYKEFGPALNNILTKFAWQMSGISGCSDVLYDPKTYEADLYAEYEKVKNYQLTESGLYDPEFWNKKLNVIKQNYAELFRNFFHKDIEQVSKEPISKNINIKLDISYMDKQIAKNHGANWNSVDKKWELNKIAQLDLEAIDKISTELDTDFYEVVFEEDVPKVKELVKDLNFTPTNLAPELLVDTPEHRRESFFKEFVYHFTNSRNYFDENSDYVGDYTRAGFSRAVNEIYDLAIFNLQNTNEENFVKIDNDNYAIIANSFFTACGNASLDDPHTGKNVRKIGKLLGYAQNAYVEYAVFDAILYRESDGKLCKTQIIDINGKSVIAKEPLESWSYNGLDFDEDFNIEMCDEESIFYDGELELD